MKLAMPILLVVTLVLMWRTTHVLWCWLLPWQFCLLWHFSLLWRSCLEWLWLRWQRGLWDWSEYVGDGHTCKSSRKQCTLHFTGFGWLSKSKQISCNMHKANVWKIITHWDVPSRYLSADAAKYYGYLLRVLSWGHCSWADVEINQDYTRGRPVTRTQQIESMISIRGRTLCTQTYRLYTQHNMCPRVLKKLPLCVVLR